MDALQYVCRTIPHFSGDRVYQGFGRTPVKLDIAFYVRTYTIGAQRANRNFEELR
jgi:hypothetical protein